MEYFDLSGGENRQGAAQQRQRQAAESGMRRRQQPSQQRRQPQPQQRKRQTADGGMRRLPVQQTAAKRRPQSRVKKQKNEKESLKRFVNFRIPEKFDFSFFVTTVILVCFGLVMLFSASHYAGSTSDAHDSMFYVNKQLIFAAIGLAAMIVLSFIDYHIYYNKFIFSVAAIGISGIMLIIKFADFGITQGGAERWISILGVQFQPSEILKFVSIMCLARIIQLTHDNREKLIEGFGPRAVVIVISCALVAIQPHLSCTIIIFVTCVLMLLIGGSKFTHTLVFVIVAFLAAMAFLEILKKLGYNYMDSRFLSFQDPEADILGDTYQTYQSLITIGSGGMFGLGLGNSRQKYGYLPITHNDFIFSVICEELGFVGAMAVILLFMVFLFRGLYIAQAAPDKFGMLLCSGIVIHIVLQAILNVAVATNAIFNTGISLPFVSYGGTALVMQLAEVGVVLNISRKAAMD